MTKFEEELMATAKMIPTSDGNEIKFKTSSALYDYLLLSNGEAELYLESQLQQQALPVVPECVGNWIEKDKNYGRSVYDGLHRLDYEAGEIAPREVAKWVFDNKENLNLFTRAWLDGYTVEKPQLFYLKHIDMSKSDAHLNWYLAKGTDNVLIHQGIKKGKSPKLKCILKLTQQEIDSMETGSYEQIPVPGEDNK
ncbi:MAG: DUF1642 domain-containing protein [Lactococcus lactis]|jgi:hypothetical protein|nr:DUF1642 domain-containing protein [Lactococcus lactis]MCI2139592.1 DUF1642 domain-containing protein [Lactococcus lactis]MCI2189579.1 DUF1642 domain-containing protein [Lactococcus lactis]